MRPWMRRAQVLAATGLIFACGPAWAGSDTAWSVAEALRNPTSVSVLMLGAPVADGEAAEHGLDCADPPLSVQDIDGLDTLPSLRRLELGVRTSREPAEPGTDTIQGEAELQRLFSLPNLTARLETLGLRGRCIHRLPAAIGQLRALKSLDLRDLGQLSVPTEFTSLPTLEEIQLCGTTFDFTLLAKLPALKRLSVCVAARPEWLGALPRLESLTLTDDGSARAFPEILARLKHLKQLGLYNFSRAARLPTLGSSSQLEKLDLSEDRFDVFPAAVTNLEKLQELSLSGSLCEGPLPDALSRLRNLRVLNLEFTCRRSLPDSLAGLQNLRELRLAYNSFDRLPAVVPKLRNLQTLSWTAHSAADVPAALKTVPNLILHLNSDEDSDKADTLKPLADFKNLRELYVEGRHSIDLSELANFPQLRGLHLNGAAFANENDLDRIGALPLLESLTLAPGWLFEFALPANLAQLHNLKRLYVSMGCSDHSYHYGDLARLQALPIEDLTLRENVCYDYIDRELIVRLFPRAAVHLVIYSGADVEHLPEDILAMVSRNNTLLDEIAALLASNPQLGTSLSDYLVQESNANIRTVSAEVQRRSAFLDLIRSKTTPAPH